MTRMYALASTFLIGTSLCAEPSLRDQFSLEAKSVLERVPCEGPIPLQVILKFKGTGKMELPVWNLDARVRFECPEGWEPRKRENDSIVLNEGALELDSLRSRREETIYLHDYFSKVSPGNVSLGLVLALDVKSSGKTEGFLLRGRLNLRILEPDAQAFKGRIRQMTLLLLEAKDNPGQRAEIYRSLQNLDHPDLVPVFVEMLGEKDVPASVFHIPRVRLVPLCLQYNEWGPLVNYLASRGNSSDASFIYDMHKKNVELSRGQKRALADAQNMWVQLAYFEKFGDQDDVDDFRDFVRAVGDLAERTKSLSERGISARGQAKQRGRNED